MDTRDGLFDGRARLRLVKLLGQEALDHGHRSEQVDLDRTVERRVERDGRGGVDDDAARGEHLSSRIVEAEAVAVGHRPDGQQGMAAPGHPAVRAAHNHPTVVGAVDPDASRRLSAGDLDDHCGDWDIVINATSASLNQNLPELPDARYRSNSLAYDMFYASEPTAFMRAAEQAGATHSKDGLGMLVGQAAASFQIWHGVEADVEPVLAKLRQDIGQV